MTAGKRLYFLDNLKWFIIWLMVVFHGAMCYMAYAPDWWYVVDTAEPVFSATAFICWADIFIMPIMFFISGYFGLMSLSRYSMKVFWQKKLIRILLPWVFGSMVIAPFVTYIILASRHSPMGFYEFYTTLFWGPLYEQAQYWYLGALTALYLLLAAARFLLPSLSVRQVAGSPSAGSVFFTFLLISLSIGIISSFMHPDTWTFYAYLLVLQPVRIPMYILVFFMGAHAWRRGWFLSGGYVPQSGPWGISFGVSGMVYLWQKFYLSYYGLAPEALVWINALCMGWFALSSLFFFLGFFHARLNRTDPALALLSSTSYGVYYLHMPILFCTAWAFVGVGLNVYLKYLCVCFLSLSACFLLSRYGLSHVASFSTGK